MLDRKRYEPHLSVSSVRIDATSMFFLGVVDVRSAIRTLAVREGEIECSQGVAIKFPLWTELVHSKDAFMPPIYTFSQNITTVDVSSPPSSAILRDLT